VVLLIFFPQTTSSQQKNEMEEAAAYLNKVALAEILNFLVDHNTNLVGLFEAQGIAAPEGSFITLTMLKDGAVLTYRNYKADVILIGRIAGALNNGEKLGYYDYGY